MSGTCRRHVRKGGHDATTLRAYDCGAKSAWKKA